MIKKEEFSKVYMEMGGGVKIVTFRQRRWGWIRLGIGREHEGQQYLERGFLIIKMILFFWNTRTTLQGKPQK